MKKIHDKFVKASFSDTGRAMAFFEKFLPEKVVSGLDLQTLQHLPESYLTDELKAYFSDMVFEVKVKNQPDYAADIILLFEHKSSPDRHVLLQVGLYMFSHWLQSVRQRKSPKPIIPIIYYQGKKKWKAKTIKGLFDHIPSDIQQYIPDIRHVFIALHSLSDEEIAAIRNKLMASAVMAQKKAFDMMKLAEDLGQIFQLFPVKTDEGNFLKTIFVYLFKVSEVPKEEWVKAVETIPSNVKENLMTTYTWMKEEGIQEGLQKGIQEGLQRGRLEKQTDVILQGYDEGLPIKMLAKITKLSEQEVVKILKKHQKIND